MKKRFMNLSLRNKITILNFFIIFLVTILLTANFYHIYKENVIHEIGSFQVKNASFVRNNIDLLETNVEALSTNLFLNQSFQNMLRLSPKQVADGAGLNENMEESINLAINTLVSNDYISYIAIYTKNGFSFYYSKYNKPNALSRIRDSADYQKMLSRIGEPYWTTYSEDSGYFAGDQSGPKLTMLRSLLDLNRYTVQGFLVICIDWNTVWSYVPHDENAYILTDGAGRILSMNTDYEPLKRLDLKKDVSFADYLFLPDKTVVPVDGEEYLYTGSKVLTDNSNVVSLMPMKTVMSAATDKAPSLLLSLLVCLAFSLIATLFTSSLVSKPLKKLVLAIRAVKKGNFVNKLHFVYHDEIGVLGEEYNKMTTELNRLFNRVLQLEIRNRESEIKTLQAQINPHFLYNTLDSIYIRALKFDRDTADMIYTLSRLMRLTLNRGSEWSRVEDEKELVGSYLALQKVRFKDRLQYQIEIDPEMLRRKIPKLILQPFVENAIVHGLDSIQRPLAVRVTGKLCGGAIRFTVRDNGCGIDPGRLGRILRGDEPGKEGHGFAICNVKERLELYYGKSDVLLHITSCVGQGTVVSINLPERGGENVSAFNSGR